MAYLRGVGVSAQGTGSPLSATRLEVRAKAFKQHG
jgi:hypothetical protein